MTLPKHIAAALEARTGAVLGTTATRLASCRRCADAVLTGLDDHVCAALVTLDTGLLDPAGELAAVLTGRRTYRLWPMPGGRYEIQRRDQFSMRTPPGPPRVLVVPAHRCGSPIGGPPWPPAPQPRGVSECPPF